MTDPFTAEERATLKKIDEDNQVAAWLNARRASPGARFLDFWSSPDTLRTVLTSMLVPLLGWLALTIYAVTLGRSSAKAAAVEAQAREEVDELSKMMPYVLKGGEDEKLAKVILQQRPGSSKPDSLIHGALLAINQKVKSESAPTGVSTPPNESAFKGPEQPVTVAQAKSKALSNPFTAPSIVYIQTYGDSEQSDALKIKAAFESEFVPVAGIENVLRTHPDMNLHFAQRDSIAVRFYRSGDKAEASYAAALIARTLGQTVAVQDLSGRNVAGVKEGMVEVWFPYVASS